MNGANFILGINLFVAGLLAAAFLVIAAYDAQRLSARWMALGYVFGMAYFGVELAIPAFSDALPVVVLAFAIFLAATVAFNIGLAHKYAVPPRIPALLVFLAVSSIVVASVQHLPRQSLPRMMAYQLPYALMQLVGVWIVQSSPRRRDWLDKLLIGVLVASAVQFASKPFMAHALGGWGNVPQTYLRTTYALVSQSLGTVFGLAVALLALVILVRDVLSEATSKSETDALSGLLNRGGFERHTALLLSGATRQGLGIALVIADLDHFKDINDSHGHASGDRVIETFAGLLLEAAGRDTIVARMGGEEFAILLPATSIVAARLFAEGTRSAFAAMPIDGLPLEQRCTASFGVAEWQPGESFGELMRRADAALYGAKKGGRDQVRIAAVAISTAEPDAAQATRNVNGRG